MVSSEPHGTADSAAKTGGFNAEDIPRSLGRYVLLKRIARGGMGEVFLASTTGIEGAERPVVVKIIRREHAKDPSFIARFLDEARVQAQLQHSGVAQVIDAAIEARTGEPYAVVEHVEGKSLGDLRARAVQIGHAVGWADAVAIAALIAEALAHVHERQDPAGDALAIVHRDLSPQNVMVSYAGDCKIIDFGTARGQNRRCHTVAGVVFAKPGYVAPEVANGDPGDARVDLYALGVMLWELCAGRRFLQGDAGVHMSAVARNTKALPPIAASTGAPEELDAILAKLTAFDRDARYLAGRTAASDLARLLGSSSALPSGERGTRARTAHLMHTLFPGEPGKTRREFARLVAAAREIRGDLPTPQNPAAATPPAPPIHAEAAGEVLPGTRYRLVAEIGRGSSSIVYEADHLDLARRVALKVMAAEPSRSSEFSGRFRREARILSRLSHEGLIAVQDVGQTADGRLFCVMELLEGETLEAFLGREKGCDWREALSITSKVLSALEVAHTAGLVHRDIKPANLFLPSVACAPFGGVKILDFGLAKSVGDGGESASADASRKAGFALFGTPEYMAPEQAASGQIDARADVYALGCVLYEMLTGRLPFVGESSVAILEAKQKGSPERPRDRAPARGIPQEIDELVMRALARHPSERFQTAMEMRLAVEHALAGPGRKRAQRRRAAVGVLAVMAAFAVVVLLGKGRGDLRAAMAWLPWHKAATVATPIAPAPEGTAVAAAGAGEDEGSLDQGEDGDLVDDGTPGETVAAATTPAPAETVAPAVTPAPAETAAAPVAKAHARKRAKSGKGAEAPQLGGDKKKKAKHTKRRAQVAQGDGQ